MYYEKRVCEYLEEAGIHVIDRNYKTRFGEIDIIAQDCSCICFIEVKYRRSKKYGSPAEAVTYSKQRTIRKVAELWSIQNPCNHNFRFDVIEVTPQEYNHIKNAF